MNKNIVDLKQFQKMSNKEEIAINFHKAGLNCAQSVVATFAEDLNYDIELAKSISCGFGSGMGRLQEKCGAITGAFMVLNILTCNKYSDNIVRKSESYKLIQKFNDKFLSLHGDTSCMGLLKTEIKTDEGLQYAKDKKLFDLVCEKLIVDAVKIVNDIIKS